MARPAGDVPRFRRRGADAAGRAGVRATALPGESEAGDQYRTKFLLCPNLQSLPGEKEGPGGREATGLSQ